MCFFFFFNIVLFFNLCWCLAVAVSVVIFASSHFPVFYLFAVLDTAAGVWCDTKSVVTSPRTGRYSADAAGGDAAVELTRRCRHAAAAVGDLIFIYGGLRGGKSNYNFLWIHKYSSQVISLCCL